MKGTLGQQEYRNWNNRELKTAGTLEQQGQLESRNTVTVGILGQ
jgi:hypothetical protein